jgi:hypothetical protein
MKFLAALPLAAVLAFPLAAHAGTGIPDAKAKAFDAKVFGGPIGEKAAACFVRRYDASHLAQHPKQKVGAMKLLMTAVNQPNEPTAYAYKVGVQFRNKPGNFDSSSSCGHMVDEDGKTVVGFVCDTSCEGTGIEIAISGNNKTAIVRLNSIGVWDRNNPDGDAITLESGADDRVFRLDRVDISECAELTDDHKEVASLQHE